MRINPNPGDTALADENCALEWPPQTPAMSYPQICHTNGKSSPRVESSVNEGLGVCWTGCDLPGYWCLHIDEFGTEIVAGGGHTSKLSELFVFLRDDFF